MNDRQNPFQDRCCYVLGMVSSEQVETASRGQKVSCEVFVCVWLRRAVFGLSAHPSVKVLFDAMAPLRASARTSVRRVMPCTGCIAKSALPAECETLHGKQRFEHSIAGLLHQTESPGLAVPSGFKARGLARDVQLRDYQTQGVAWMLAQESRAKDAGGGVPGLNGFFWEKRTFGDGDDCFYYFPLGGHALLEAPPVAASKTTVNSIENSTFGGLRESG